MAVTSNITSGFDTVFHAWTINVRGEKPQRKEIHRYTNKFLLNPHSNIDKGIIYA